MEIIQFEDKSLSHYSYSIISHGEMAIIDPARNPEPYYELARAHNATITAVIETHPHADFISSHLEIHKTTGAVIYGSHLFGAGFNFKGLEEGGQIALGEVKLQTLITPGHSPDSICMVAVNKEDQQVAVFTGDTLFIGDCGRPDLRESAGNFTAARETLSRQMYHSLREKLMTLPDEVLVYPAHGAGSLCGKGLSSNNSSTIGIEKATNWCLQEMSEADFITSLLDSQPFVPKYFPYDVELNRKGAENYALSTAKVAIGEKIPSRLKEYLLIDTRNESAYKKGHLRNSVNLMDDLKFETWLGSLIAPGEKFYLLAPNRERLDYLIQRIAEIGYEGQIEQAFVVNDLEGELMKKLDLHYFKSNPGEFTILDIRNPSEIKEGRIFPHTVDIPFYELRERLSEIPDDKPIVVHCAGGFRSAAGASLLKNYGTFHKEVFDLGEAVKTF